MLGLERARRCRQEATRRIDLEFDMTGRIVTVFRASENVRKILDRDAAELQIAVRVDAPFRQARDQRFAFVAEVLRERGRPVVAPGAQPGEEWLPPRGIELIDRPRDRLHRFPNGRQIENTWRGTDFSVRDARSLQRLPVVRHGVYRSSMAPELDRSRLDEIVSAIAERLEGDWLLIGGALVSLWLRPGRSTEDVDVIGLAGTPAARLALMNLAVDLGLPIEAVNSAADFFVQRIAGWREEIVVFRTGARGRVFRPTATLFLLLKVPRLSASDLADCLDVIAEARAATTERLDVRRVVRALDALPASPDHELTSRRAELRSALSHPR